MKILLDRVRTAVSAMALGTVMTAPLAPFVMTAAAELPPIDRLVPRETILVLEVPDVSKSWERLQATPIGAFIRSDEVQELWRELRDDDDLGEALRDAGLESIEDAIPSGRLGLALFLELDEELGLKRPVLLLGSDYGDRAERIAQAFRSATDKAVREDGVRMEERTVRGRTVIVREQPEPAPDDDDEFDFDDDFDFDPFGLFDFDPASVFGDFRTTYFVRDEGRILVSTSLIALEDALGAIDGEALRDSLSGNPEHQEAIAQLSARAGAGAPVALDGHAILYTAPLQTLLGQFLGAPLAMAQPFVNQLFGDIRAHSFGLEFGDGESMATLSVGTLTPRGRVGLLTLIDGSASRGPLPGFVGADAVGYGTMALRLDRLMPMVNQIVQGLPPMVGDMAMPMLEQFGPALEQAFGGLGPDMHVVSYPPSNPGEAGGDDGQTAVVIRCTRLEAVNSLVAMLGPGIGLMPRDFLGQTIYSGGESPVSIGLGGGWMAIGTDESVERVLRSIGQADQPTLGDEATFRQAVAALPAGDLLGWGFSDTIATLRAQRGMVLEMIRGAVEGAEIDDARAMRLIERLTDPDRLERYFGPQAWTFEARGDGLVYRSMFLRPTAAD